jgi:ribosome-binding factor A
VSSWRPESVGRFIQQTLGELVQSRVKDPRLGFVTITGCRVSKDLKVARVFVSVMGSEEERSASMETLGRASSFLRKELAGQLRMRHTPELIFAYDDSIERGSRISKLLDDLKDSEETDNEARDTAD